MYQETSHLYDFFGAGSEESPKRAAFILSFLSNKGLIVDVGAGNGEIAFHLAHEGHRLFCFEPSSSMSSILFERAAREINGTDQVSVFPVKVEELKSSLGADLAFASSVFSHLSKEERTSLLRGLRHHLKPGGLFIFNCVQFVPSRPDRPLTKIGERVLGGVFYRHFDSARQMNQLIRKVTWKFEIEYRGQVLNEYAEDFFLQMDSEEGVRSLLEAEGFQVVNFFGSYEKVPSEKDRPGFVVVAAR
jgi:SAM-dependent methyltransferase